MISKVLLHIILTAESMFLRVCVCVCMFRIDKLGSDNISDVLFLEKTNSPSLTSHQLLVVFHF